MLDFVRYMEGLEENQIRQAALLVAGWFNISPETPSEATERADVGQAEVKVPEEEINAPLTFELKNLDAKHPYLKQRGLALKTIKEFGLGYYSRGLMKDRVVVPIHNAKGELVACPGRAPGEPREGGAEI